MIDTKFAINKNGYSIVLICLLLLFGACKKRNDVPENDIAQEDTSSILDTKVDVHPKIDGTRFKRFLRKTINKQKETNRYEEFADILYFSPNVTDAFEWKAFKISEDSLGFTHYESYYFSYNDCKRYKEIRYVANTCKILVKYKILEPHEFVDILMDDAYFWSEALEYDIKPDLEVKIFNKWGQETKSVNVLRGNLSFFAKMMYCSHHRMAQPCEAIYMNEQYNIFE